MTFGRSGPTRSITYAWIVGTTICFASVYVRKESYSKYGAKALVAQERAGRLVRVEEGRAVTYKITKNLADREGIEGLPGVLHETLGIGCDWTGRRTDELVDATVRRGNTVS